MRQGGGRNTAALKCFQAQEGADDEYERKIA
jgi:hypothetical protein